MGRYLALRLVALVVSLLGISILTFGLGALAPGDPAEVILQRALGQPATADQITQERRALGLDRPLVVQYRGWLAKAVRGDLGASWNRGRSVTSIMAGRIPRTAALALTAAALAVVLGVSAGVVAAVHSRSPLDHASRAGALLATAFPSYFTGYVLILLFAIKLRVLPAFGAGSPAKLVLPAVTLALSEAATLSRLTRSSVLDVLGQDYVRTANAKGARQTAVLAWHVVPNAFIPVLTLSGLFLGRLLGGAVIVETVFAWPGVGQLAVEAIQARDFPLLQGVVLFSGLVYVLLNFAVDAGYMWFDPRIRLVRRRPG